MNIHQAIKEDKAQILTLELAKSLKGKRIQTKYFGYKGQNGVDDFIVGDILSEYQLAEKEPNTNHGTQAKYWESYMPESRLNEQKNTFCILTKSGRNTYIRTTNDTFWCSDSDRDVYFIVLEDDAPQLPELVYYIFKDSKNAEVKEVTSSLSWFWISEKHGVITSLEATINNSDGRWTKVSESDLWELMPNRDEN